MHRPLYRDALLWNALQQKLVLAARAAKVGPDELHVSWYIQRPRDAVFTITLRGQRSFVPIPYWELLRDNSHPSPIGPLAQGIMRALLSREVSPIGTRLTEPSSSTTLPTAVRTSAP